MNFMDTAKASTKIDAHPLEFSGRGAEYFRVWLVNVLLSLVTLGFYTPFARRRTAQYFYGHTWVANSPLEFTAQPRKMFFGFLLLVVLYLAFKLTANSGNDVALSVFMVCGAVLAPYLWGSAMRFRLASTRWRGVRLAFVASWRDVYLASWPLFVLALVWAALAFAVAGLLPAGPGLAREVVPPVPAGLAWPVGGLVLGAAVLSLLCVIRLSFNYQGLLVRQARIGMEPGRWKPAYGDFVRIWLAAAGVFLLVVAAGGLLLAGGGWLALSTAWRSASGAARLALVFLLIFGAILGVMVATVPARAYREARMFKLIWNNVGVSRIARFTCELAVGRYVGLRMKNLLLTMLTLGFYRPFARVSEYAMKVHSVTLHLKGSADQLAGQLVDQQGALGDALADAVGLDLVG